MASHVVKSKTIRRGNAQYHFQKCKMIHGNGYVWFGQVVGGKGFFSAYSFRDFSNHYSSFDLSDLK